MRGSEYRYYYNEEFLLVSIHYQIISFTYFKSGDK